MTELATTAEIIQAYINVDPNKFYRFDSKASAPQEYKNTPPEKIAILKLIKKRIATQPIITYAKAKGYIKEDAQIEAYDKLKIEQRFSVAVALAPIKKKKVSDLLGLIKGSKTSVKPEKAELKAELKQPTDEDSKSVLTEDVDEYKILKARNELKTKDPRKKSIITEELKVTKEDAEQLQEEHVLESKLNVILGNAENEDLGLTPFQQKEDNLEEIYVRNTYTAEQKEKVNSFLKDKTEEVIDEYIFRARFVDVFMDPEAVVDVFVEPEVTPVAVVDTQSENQALGSEVSTDDIPRPIEEQESKKELEYNTSGSLTVPFKDRYHPVTLEIFFKNASNPSWDKALEARINNLKIDELVRISMMNGIIEEFGKQIYVTERKGSTLEELNELIQMQYFVEKLAQSDIVGVKLSQLIKIDKIANGADVTGTSSTVVPNAITPLPSNSESGPGSENNQTKETRDFNRYYDRLRTIQGLGGKAVVQPAKVYQGKGPNSVTVPLIGKLGWDDIVLKKRKMK